MNRPIATLTTDWGAQGFFVGMVKGALMQLVSGVQVVDVCHLVEPFDIATASFVVRNACLGFPEGTVHIVDVASQPPFVALRARGQYFICSDNGLPSLAFGDEVEAAVDIAVQPGGLYNFAAYKLYVDVAARLMMGIRLEDIGQPHGPMLNKQVLGYVQQEGHYRLYVRYVDRYGNAYLGMTHREFEDLRQGRPFTIETRSLKTSRLSTNYYAEPEASQMGLQFTVSATGYLELAICRAPISQLEGLEVGSSVLLHFD
ncbi:MAG: SAM-dependent chlorinase/fluorinase [Bacteroidales bacterium]|nr:SAM-dependent chlorinase/fluorinase [Bacteroidales bacterium]